MACLWIVLDTCTCTFQHWINALTCIHAFHMFQRIYLHTLELFTVVKNVNLLFSRSCSFIPKCDRKPFCFIRQNYFLLLKKVNLCFLDHVKHAHSLRTVPVKQERGRPKQIPVKSNNPGKIIVQQLYKHRSRWFYRKETVMIGKVSFYSILNFDTYISLLKIYK